MNGNRCEILKPNFVINKSSQQFTHEEMILLNNGLKYRPKPSQPPVNEIIVAIETSIKTLPNDKKACVRENVATFLSQQKINEINDSKEWKIIKDLKQKDCVFVAPDKGKGVVIMDKTAYEEAAYSHLNTPAFQKVVSRREFPVDTLQNQVKEELKSLS
jgi:hypothetical protein